MDHIPATSEELKQIKKEIREKSVLKLEKNFILHALKQHGWNITQAALSTGMQRPNFQNMMKKHGIQASDKPG